MRFGTNAFASKEELEERHNIIVDENFYVELKFIIKTAIEKLGSRTDKLPVVQCPIQPFLVHLAFLTKKGFSRYYHLLRRAKNIDKCLTTERQERWHNELEKVLSVDFWNGARKQVKGVINDNPLKWLQFQILNNSQFTNYRVSKFRYTVSPLCTYCRRSNETISHLYYLCDNVKELWQQLTDWLETFSINMELSVTTVLFGLINEDTNSVKNTFILWTKSFIWKNKFFSDQLNLPTFKSVLKHRLDELKDVYEYKNNETLFKPWINIYNSLL